MNVNNFNDFLETLKEAKRRRQVCMLTEALMYLLRITQGHGLAALLGFPHACNNLEAVACWVAEHVDESDTDISNDKLGELAEELQRQLLDLIEE